MPSVAERPGGAAGWKMRQRPDVIMRRAEFGPQDSANATIRQGFEPVSRKSQTKQCPH